MQAILLWQEGFKLLCIIPHATGRDFTKLYTIGAEICKNGGESHQCKDKLSEKVLVSI